MEMIEVSGCLKYKDAEGNVYLLLPQTSKDNVSGIENVDNTSDAEKPVSTAQAAAIADAKKAGTDAQENLTAHNTNTSAHTDLRLELKALADRINAALDSDDETLDELSEIVAYIKSNKNLIEAITTSKVNVVDIVDNLLTPDSKKPLSANQGVALKKMIDDTAQTFTATIPLAWVEDAANGGYTQTVAVDGILATDNPIADIVLGADLDANALYLEAWACITRITSADGAITLYANEGAPETAFTVQLKVVR